MARKAAVKNIGVEVETPKKETKNNVSVTFKRNVISDYGTFKNGDKVELPADVAEQFKKWGFVDAGN